MKKKELKILIFCEKSKTTGEGHFVRSRRLYQFLYEKNFKVGFYFNKSSYQISKIIEKENSKLYLVIDYKSYQKIYVKKNINILKIINVENLKKKFFYKNINIYPLDIQFKKNSGPKFYFYPKSFSKIGKNNIFKKWKNTKKIKILIIQGGTDANNNLNKIIDVILNNKLDFNYELIVKAKEKKFIYKKYLNNKKIKVFGKMKHIHKLYQKIHIAVSACGGTAFELGYLGIPAIHVTSEPREKERALIFEKKNLGIFYSPKNSKDIICELNKICLNKNYRTELIKKKMNYFRQKNYFTKLFK